TAHDEGEPRQGRFALQAEQLEHGVERAAFANMAELEILDIERHTAAFTRDVDHLVRVDKQNPRLRIQKTANQPGASDAIDFRAPARHPNARSFWRQPVEF